MPPTPSTTTDRDLLVLEPGLFRDISFLGQQTFRGQVSLASGVLTAVTGSFADSQVEAGHIVLVDDRPLEILERTGSTTALISLPRASVDSPAIIPPDFSARAAVITTFAPQIALIHAQMLRLLDLDHPSGPDESAITNPADFRAIVRLGALHLIHSAAAALLGADSPAGRRADMYRLRFIAERRRARIQLDLDGDGLPDATRTLSTITLIR